MTAAQALADRRTIRRLAGEADCDVRVVRSVLAGESTAKGARVSYTRPRILAAMASMGIDPAQAVAVAPAPTVGTQATGGECRALALVPGTVERWT